MNAKVNLAGMFAGFTEAWSPKVLGELNGQHVKIARFRGEFVWHQHEHEDELFLVVKGRMTIRLRDREVSLDEGELFIVPRGVEHQPFAEQEAWVLMLEPAGTINTGSAGGGRTVEPEWLVEREDPPIRGDHR
jgi:mannose-6-phosphate isomerase-like protein (cupin superfamily)